MQKLAFAIRIAFLLLMFVGNSVFSKGTIRAQSPAYDLEWTVQQRIPFHYYEAFAPVLIADKNGTVHAFHYVDQVVYGEENKTSEEFSHTAIYYRQWTPANGWSEPNDIFLPPPLAPEFSLQGVILDGDGIFHLIFYAGDQFNAAIYYSKVPAILAHNAAAWSKPALIGEEAGPIAWASLASNDMGGVIVLYEGKELGPGLHEIHSTDSGNAWSEPVLFYLEPRDGYFPLAIEVSSDEQGRFHAVWSIFSSHSVSSEEIYYAVLAEDYLSWSNPYLLATKDKSDYEVDWPSIVAYKGELIVIYNKGNPTSRHMVRSIDSGKTWSQPVRPFLLEGETGAPVFLVDSNETLHLVISNRLPETNRITHGIWHSVWLGNNWSTPELIIGGDLTTDFNPTRPEAIISRENVLLATWVTDTSYGPRNGAWYSFSTLDSQILPIIPLPSLTPVSTPNQTLIPTPSPLPTTIANSLFSYQGSPDQISQRNPASSMMTVVMIVVALLGGFILLYTLYRNTHN